MTTENITQNGDDFKVTYEQYRAISTPYMGSEYQISVPCTQWLTMFELETIWEKSTDI